MRQRLRVLGFVVAISFHFFVDILAWVVVWNVGRSWVLKVSLSLLLVSQWVIYMLTRSKQSGDVHLPLKTHRHFRYL